MTSAFAISQFPASIKGTNSEVWRLVIIDDSPDDRVEVRRLLLKGSDRRYQFMESESGESGLRMVLDGDAGLPHCVVLDYHLPDMDAPEVLEVLTGTDGTPVCPVVVLTGSGVRELGLAVLRAGAQDFLGKSSMTPESMTRAVENAVERWRMARELRERALRDVFRLVLSEALRLNDSEMVLVTAAQVLGQHVQSSRVVYAEVESDGVVVVGPGYSNGVADIPGRYKLDDFGSVLRREYEAGRPVIIADVMSDPLYTEEDRKHYNSIGVVANLGVPLLRDGKLVSVLSVHDSVPRKWTAHEVALAAETAEATWSAVQRVRSESNQRAGEERFQNVLRQSPAGIIQTDADGRMTLVNQRWCEMLGYLEAELLGQIVVEVTHPAHRDATLSAFMRMADGGPDFVLEKQYVRRDGTALWAISNVSALRGPAGEFHGLLAVILDISERKATEGASARRNDGLSILSEAAALLFSADDPDQTVKDLVKKAARYLDADVFVNYKMITREGDVDPYLLLDFAGGLDGQTQSVFERLKLGESLCGLTAVNRTPTYLPDVQADTRPEAAPVQALGVASYISCPLLAGDRVLGILSFASLTPGRFRPDDLEFVRIISHHVAAAKERLRIEQELVVSESFYRQALESIPGMVFTNSPDGACDYISNQWSEFTGVSPAEQFGSGWLQLLHPEDRSRAFAEWQSAVIRGDKYDLEYRVRKSDKRYEWFKVRSRAIRNEAGAIVRWLGTAVNVNDLKDTEQALVLRERELQSLADNTPDILTRFDREFRHAFVNTAVEKATGRSRTEFLGKTNRELGMSAELCDLWESALHCVFENASPKSLEFSFETPNGRRDYTARLVPEFATDGSVEFVLGVTHDITERKQFEQTLADQDRRKDEFLATLAHELRNPLAPIRSGFAVLRADCTADESEMALGIIDRQLGHMVNLIDDLLDISRVRTGKISLRKERVTIRAAVDAAIEACQPTIDEKGHALEVGFSAESLEVHGDKTRLVQIVANLLTNAAKYSEPGASISLVVARDGDEAIISVSDNGMGISQETLPTLWDMFSQVRDTLDKAQGGLGIGLSLVKKLVQMHGGSVGADSEGLGKGSTFTVRLPLIPANVDVARTVPAPKGIGPNSSGGRRVLVVDDNKDGAKTLGMFLKLHGHEIATAFSGPLALETAQTFKPEVVLLDIGLPGMDGYEVARRLRADPEAAGVVLIALTGWGSESDKQKSNEAGFDLHLTKPVDVKEVQGILARLTPANGNVNV